MISGKHITWQFKASQNPILKNVSFTLNPGRITTFMGPSGAGKTTLLKCVANLYSDYEGIITCGGIDLKKLNPMERTSKIGFVHQQFHLFPHLSVLQNCTYALVHVAQVELASAEQRVLELLGTLGISDLTHCFPGQLSGGQQQRVAIARSLSLRPSVLLLDEPTSALDPESKKSLETLLLQLNTQGITIALSSHDMPFIHKIKDCIYFMERGAIVEEWDKQDLLLPGSKISQFLSHMDY
jgi:ABC-type polar amino acid transport system ATPase subunit